ncbi:MAG: hypothetical protein QXW46_06125 [Sulfolobales archaeon]
MVFAVVFAGFCAGCLGLWSPEMRGYKDSRDYPVLVGWGVVVSIILVILNLSIDIIHSLVDPRVSSYEA